MAQKDLKSRIGSVKNIQKITRAMEMVAAARLRRAEQRIEHLRPYAGAIRRMTRQAAAAAENIPSLPILQEHEQVHRVGLVFVTGDRGLAGAFNSQILRAGLRAAAEHSGEGHDLAYYASGRRGVSSLTFRGLDLAGQLHRLHRPPRLRERARDRRGRDDRLRGRRPRPGRDLLQRLHLAAHAGGPPRDAAAAAAGDHPGGAARRTTRTTRGTARSSSTSPTPRRSCSA